MELVRRYDKFANSFSPLSPIFIDISAAQKVLAATTLSKEKLREVSTDHRESYEQALEAWQKRPAVEQLSKLIEHLEEHQKKLWREIFEIAATTAKIPYDTLAHPSYANFIYTATQAHPVFKLYNECERLVKELKKRQRPDFVDVAPESNCDENGRPLEAIPGRNEQCRTM